MPPYLPHTPEGQLSQRWSNPAEPTSSAGGSLAPSLYVARKKVYRHSVFILVEVPAARGSQGRRSESEL